MIGKTFRRHIGGAGDDTRRHTHRPGGDRRDTSARRVDSGIDARRRCVVDGDDFEERNFEGQMLFGAADTGSADPDRPDTFDFVEMSRRTGGMSIRTFAAQLVETPTLSMAVIAE